MHRIGIQWGSEIWPIKIQKHMKSGLLEIGFQIVRYLDIFVWILNGFRQKGCHLSGFQMVGLPDFRSHSKLFSSYPKEARQLLNGCWLIPPSKCRSKKAQLWENWELKGKMKGCLSENEMFLQWGELLKGEPSYRAKIRIICKPTLFNHLKSRLVGMRDSPRWVFWVSSV